MRIALPVTAREAEAAFVPLARFAALALAVSGGPDSLALMHLAAGWSRARGAPRLTVLTVDHGLRPESQAEAAMVAGQAEALGLRHAELTWADGRVRAGALQERARVARYGLMASYCCAHGIPALATAHHLDDQAETFLMRLRRGSGLDGLAAIPEASRWAGIRILRPFLEFPKARLVATLREAGIAWSEDPSNGNPRFERAALRANHDALAALGLTPEALVRSARRLRRARLALEAGAAELLARHASFSAAGYCRISTDLIQAPDELALRALGKAIAAIGGREPPPRLAKLEALFAALKQASGKVHTLGGCRVQPSQGGIGIFRETRRTGLSALSLQPGAWALWDNRFMVVLGSKAKCPITVRALGDDAFYETRPNHQWLAAVPPLAGRTLPSGWVGDRLALIAVPASIAPALQPKGEAGLSFRFVGGGFPWETELAGLEALKEA